MTAHLAEPDFGTPPAPAPAPADSTPTSTPDVTPAGADIPVQIGLVEITKLLPVAPQTVYRWRLPRAGKPPVLPDPHRTVSGTPLWLESTVLELAEARGYKVDRKVLAKIRKSQGH